MYSTRTKTSNITEDEMYFEICIRAFCDEDHVLQVLHNRHIICDLQMLPAMMCKHALYLERQLHPSTQTKNPFLKHHQ